jgi:hypothetical protein
MGDAGLANARDSFKQVTALFKIWVVINMIVNPKKSS